MPSFFKHSNRSKSAALNNPGARTPSISGSASSILDLNLAHHDPARALDHQPRPAYAAQTGVAPDYDLRIQQGVGDFPSPSQSIRKPSDGYQDSESSTDDLAFNSGRPQHLQYQQPSQQQPQPQPHQGEAAQLSRASEHKKSRSIFDRIRSSKPEPRPPAQRTTSSGSSAGLTRRKSKRQEIPAIQASSQSTLVELHKFDWPSAHDSTSRQPSPRERPEDGGELDPFLIRDPGPHSVGREDGRLRTIRPLQGDPEPPTHSQNDEQAQQEYHRRAESQGYYYQATDRSHQPQVSNISPKIPQFIGDPRQRNPETISQFSFESQVDAREDQQRPVSVQSNGQSSSSLSYPQHQELQSRTTSTPQGPRPPSQHTMAPPGNSSANRRPGDSKQTLQAVQGEPRDGSALNYNRAQLPGSQPPAAGMGSAPPGATPGTVYRGGPIQREYSNTGMGELGRSTPPPVPGERDVTEMYKELMTKYKKVKGLYFEKTAQVEQLQNALANQRLSQSRTSLDDSEYMTRFQRLDGATTNLAFNIRKHWRTVPAWLSQSVNQDAVKIGKQEMTAVGRACITKFLVDEIFNRTFHPGLEVELSTNLKAIEKNIRRFSPVLNSQEESDALTAKVVQWRLATVEGLRDALHSPLSEEYRKEFLRMAATNLTASLINFLQDPIPAGIEDSAYMIVELAISIASNLPLESRDIAITYPMPGDAVHASYMKVELGIPALDNPGAETADTDSASMGSLERDEREEGSEKKSGKKDKTKSSILSAMMGGGSSSGGTNSRKPSSSSSAPNSISESCGGEGRKFVAEDGTLMVRFAGFLAVEVRGRQILAKAPVFTAIDEGRRLFA
ncbi:hypothetical protein LZ554_006812 [Drepanopeziza brunnea f. sp. 'monogermtubi']|nr:hypothetical protein LZ554_006812 [Drepanopeziza brunnea f. sp. 'monogermtubi']